MKRKTGTKTQARKSATTTKSAAVVAASPAVVGPKSEGQRLLCALTHTASEIGDRVGASKQIVALWRRGEKSPGPVARVKLSDAFAIPTDAWDRIPGSVATSKPREASEPTLMEPRAAGTGTALEECLALLKRLDEELKEPGITPTMRRGIIGDQVKALALRARLEKDEELLEDRIVREHPFWHRIRASIVGAVAPFPDAARAVVEALRELGEVA